MTTDAKLGKNLPSIETIRFSGGCLCLDFTNTMDPRAGKAPHECLTSAVDLVTWGQRGGVLGEDEAQHLLREAHLHPTRATLVLERTIVLRETIYRIFSSVACGTTPRAEDVESLRSTFVELMAHTQIAATPDGFTWQWARREETFDRIVWSVARSAVDLLTANEVKRVRQCPGLGDCGWLFLDTSKNGSRQWCRMEGCGSRAKMRQHYARKHAVNKH